MRNKGCLTWACNLSNKAQSRTVEYVLQIKWLKHYHFEHHKCILCVIDVEFMIWICKYILSAEIMIIRIPTPLNKTLRDNDYSKYGWDNRQMS